MTYRKFKKQFNHYKNDYDFKLKKVSYEKLGQLQMESEEWLS